LPNRVTGDIIENHKEDDNETESYPPCKALLALRERLKDLAPEPVRSGMDNLALDSEGFGTEF